MDLDIGEEGELDSNFKGWFIMAEDLRQVVEGEYTAWLASGEP